MHNVSDTKRETHDTSDYIRGDIFFVCMNGHKSNLSVNWAYVHEHEYGHM